MGRAGPVDPDQHPPGVGADTVDTTAEFAAGDIRATIPRFTQKNRAANQALLDDLVTQVATAHDATPAQVALVWLPTECPSITPIPGTRRLQRREENIGATELDLSENGLAALGQTATDWASQALGTTRRCIA